MSNVFPDGFLWGAATAAHQVEGGNTSSDFWVLENTAGTIFAEPSGDACDQWNRYREDIRTLADLGLTTYRFSIEWARVEPQDGVWDDAAIAHYRDVLNACHEAGLQPMVTLHHFTSPAWLMGLGGWAVAGTADRFALYSAKIAEELGELIPYVCTINEANIAAILQQMGIFTGEGDAENASIGVAGGENFGAWMAACAEQFGVTPDKLKPFLFAGDDASQRVIKDAHRKARDAYKAVRPEAQVGITLALHDVQGPNAEHVAEHNHQIFGQFTDALAGDDFIGVQNYTRNLIDEDGKALPVPEGHETTQMGYEFYPEALENVIRLAATAGKPLIVTENGLSATDDTRRVEFVQRALAGVQRALADGIDVRGYYYWSALDNYEWMFGYRPTFGIIAVDRSTQERTVKESARVLGRIAKANAL